MKNWERKEIDLARLTVDLENFRIGEQENPRAAYHAILEEQRDNLTNLAADIIENGLNPAELAIVYPDPEKAGQYIAVEGNRRLTALRILDTPALATGTPWHAKFVELSKRYKAGTAVKKIFCCVMKDKAAAMLWMDRKHLFLGGRGLAQWNAQATARADAFRGKVRPSKAVMDFLQLNKKLPATLAKSLARKTTNIDRVFQTPYFRSALGANVEKDGQVTFASGDAKRGQDLLLRMLKAIAEPGFTVDKIRHDTDRKDFIDGFAEYNVLAPSSTGGSSGGAAAKKAASRGRKAALPIDRTTLAIKGKEYHLHVTDPRLGGLYREALLLQPSRLRNSGGMLTRVFLELSTDHFLSEKKIPLPANHLAHGRKKWSDLGIALREKITAVLKELDPTNKAAEFREVRKGLSDPHALHSIESLHDFIHSLKPDPDPTEVKRIWGRWHPYFAALFGSLV